MAIVPTSQAGVGIFSNAGADVVADLAGWFVGTPGPGDAAPADQRPPAGLHVDHRSGGPQQLLPTVARP